MFKVWLFECIFTNTLYHIEKLFARWSRYKIVDYWYAKPIMKEDKNSLNSNFHNTLTLLKKKKIRRAFIIIKMILLISQKKFSASNIMVLETIHLRIWFAPFLYKNNIKWDKKMKEFKATEVLFLKPVKISNK